MLSKTGYVAHIHSMAVVKGLRNIQMLTVTAEAVKFGAGAIPKLKSLE